MPSVKDLHAMSSRKNYEESKSLTIDDDYLSYMIWPKSPSVKMTTPSLLEQIHGYDFPIYKTYKKLQASDLDNHLSSSTNHVT